VSNSPAPLRIVIADDDELVLLMVEQAVRTYAPAAQIVTAPDGQAALVACVEQPAHLLITDDQMPHLTGTELTRSLRLAGHTMVILLTSGYYLDEDAAFAAGADFVFSKPWNITHLRRILTLAQERRDSSR
jgi:CheY-like chemotaxis protein